MFRKITKKFSADVTFVNGFSFQLVQILIAGSMDALPNLSGSL